MASSLSRRRFLAAAGGAAGAAALGPAGAVEALARPGGGRAPHPKTPTEALWLLQAGNKRYPASKYGAIGDVIDHLPPTVESLPAERHLARCVLANAIAQAGELSRRGPIVAPAIAEGKIRVVAAVYNIANGAVSIVR